jgi:glutathione-S-conjugate glycine hydrolase
MSQGALNVPFAVFLPLFFWAMVLVPRMSITAAVLSLPLPLVSLDSGEGTARLLRSLNASASASSASISEPLQSPFSLLTSEFMTQFNGAFCGVASCCTVLNALGVPRPLFDGKEPPGEKYYLFTQTNFFENGQTGEVKTFDEVAASGMTLNDIVLLLQSVDGVKARKVSASDLGSVDALRSELVPLLRTGGRDSPTFVIYNYDRAALNTIGSGHISPLAAYDDTSDSFLLLDVARYKYAPHWVPADLLFAGANTQDPIAGTRGFVLASTDPSFQEEDDPPPPSQPLVVLVFASLGILLVGCISGGTCVGCVWPVARRKFERFQQRRHVPLGADDSASSSTEGADGVSLSEASDS